MCIVCCVSESLHCSLFGLFCYVSHYCYWFKLKKTDWLDSFVPLVLYGWLVQTNFEYCLELKSFNISRQVGVTKRRLGCASSRRRTVRSGGARVPRSARVQCSWRTGTARLRRWLPRELASVAGFSWWVPMGGRWALWFRASERQYQTAWRSRLLFPPQPKLGSKHKPSKPQAPRRKQELELIPSLLSFVCCWLSWFLLELVCVCFLSQLLTDWFLKLKWQILAG